MKPKVIRETAKETSVENATKKSNIALAGIKKGAVAARQAAAKIASAPSKMYDTAIYGVCYGVSYGVVFTSLAIVKLMPANSVATKGFHDGAEGARKDFQTRQEKIVLTEDSTVVG